MMLRSLFFLAKPKESPASTYWKTNRVKSKTSCKIAHLIHEHVNWERTSRGIPPLSYDHHLAFIARGHSRDMAHYDYLGHINKQGEGPTKRAARKGYECKGGMYSGVAENCHQLWSMGYTSSGKKYSKKLYDLARDAVRGWMASSGHRANILNPNYRVEGVGFARSRKQRSKVYVTQNFYG